MCSLHAVILSEITPRYFTWLAKEIFRPFNVRWTSAGLSLWEVHGLSLNSVDFHVPALTLHLYRAETSLQFLKTEPLYSLSHIYRYRQQRDLVRYQCVGRIIHIHTVRCGGTRQNLVAPPTTLRCSECAFTEFLPSDDRGTYGQSQLLVCKKRTPWKWRV
jgi:hypothetical protein